MINISMERILVPIDGSIYSRRALAMATDIADRYSAQIFLLYVMSDQPDAEPLRHYLNVLKQTNGDEGEIASIEKALEDSGLFEGEKLLNVWAQLVENRGIPEPTKLLIQGKPGDEVKQSAEDIDADLIVMGRRGLGEIKQAFVGSVTTHVQSKSDKPILTLH